MKVPPADRHSVPAMTIDWGTGRYERIAEQLLPAAQVVVDTAAPRASERVLDVGCGTGNAALLAAARGSLVVGVDPAFRLLDVARDRARDAGLDVDFRVGEAAALPVEEASFDVVVSVFGVIFAADPQAAFAGLVRALAPRGRAVISAWLPGGAIARMGQVAGEAVRDALGGQPEPPRYPWHDSAGVAALAEPHGTHVVTAEHTLAFTAESPQAFVDAEGEQHPVALAGLRTIRERGGDPEALRRRLVAVLTDGNEDPTAFRATSRYVVHTIARR